MASLVKNTFLLTGASILQKAVAFIYFAAIARTIGTSDTGSYFLALALVTTVGVFTDVGVNSVLIRDSARSQEHTKGFLQRALGIKLIAALLAIVLATFLPTILGYDADTSFLVRLAIPIMIADSLSLTMYGALRGAQELRYESLGIFIGQSLTTIVGVVALLKGNVSLSFLVIALLIGSAWNAAFSAYHVGRRIGFRSFIPRFDGARDMLFAAFPFFLAAVFVKIYSFVDSFTLQMVIGASAVGLYSVAYKLTYAFQFLPLAFIGALYPKMASLVGKPDDLKKVFLESQWYLAFLVSPIVFGIFALAPEIIRLAYGSDYGDSVLPLSVLIFVLIPIFFDFPIGSLLNATGRQKTKTAIMGVTMVVNFIANMTFIRSYGIVGASIAACISFVVMFGLGAVAIKKEIAITVRDWIRATGGFLLAGAVMSTSILLLKQFIPIGDDGASRYIWLALIPFGACIFGIVSVATKALTLEHFRKVRSYFRKQTYGAIPVVNE
ncbi:MAG: oligosaccharide flippase family protein [Patescibacteria group bacterium]|jgi:O-antigen/teichoic acid export membrane protein